MWRRLTAFSLAILLVGNVCEAGPRQHGAATAPSTSDPLPALLRSMAANSFKLISSPGAGSNNFQGIKNDQLSCFTNNGSAFTLFDGSTNPDASYNGNLVYNATFPSGNPGPQNPYTPCDGVIPEGVGSLADPSFSSQSCDVAARKCILWSGGHIDGGDGSLYVFDINAAITSINNAACLANPATSPSTNTCHWTVPPNLHSARYIPQSETLPSTPTITLNTPSATGAVFTASFTGPCSTSCTISYTGSPDLRNHGWLGAQGANPNTVGLSHFVELSCPSGCSSPVSIVCPTIYQPCLTTSETNVTLTEVWGQSGVFWSVPNDTGNVMPYPDHTYLSDFLIPGTTKVLVGGGFVWAGNPTAFNQNFFVLDFSGGGSVTNTSSMGWGAQAAPCYYNGNLYGTPSTALSVGPASGFIAMSAGFTATVSGTSGQYNSPGNFLQVVCMTDPVNGAGHGAVFQENTASGGSQNTTNTFTVTTDVAGTPSTGSHTFVTTISSVLASGQNTGYRIWIPSTDGTFMWAWEGGGSVYKLLTPSNLNNWTLTEVDGGAATGNIPQHPPSVGNATNAVMGYDIGGASGCHAPLLLVAGDVYIYKPPGCAP